MKDTRQNIIDAFFKLAEHKPINTIKVRHITDKSGCDRSTFYRYFDDVYDMLDQIENDVIKRITDDVEKSYIKNTSYEEILAVMADACSKYGNILNILLSPDGSPSFRNKYMNALKPIISSIMFKKNLEYNEFTAEYAVGAFVSVVTYWCGHRDMISSDELASLVYRLMSKGVFPEK